MLTESYVRCLAFLKASFSSEKIGTFRKEKLVNEAVRPFRAPLFVYPMAQGHTFDRLAPL